jgi:SNF2 family DNA or RNA helicase
MITLRPLQREVLNELYLKQITAGILNLGQRTGKTIISFEWAKYKGYQNILFISPPSAHLNIKEDSKHYDWDLSHVMGTAKREKEAIENYEKGILLIRKESLKKYVSFFRTFKFDLIVWDELYLLKNQKAAITKLAIELFSSHPNKLGLTGVLFDKYENLWSQCQFINPKIFNNMGYYKWLKTYSVKGPFGPYFSKRHQAMLREKLAPHIIRRSSSDSGEIRVKVLKYLIPLPVKIMDKYIRLATEFLLLEDGIDTVHRVAIETHLRALCCGRVKDKIYWKGKYTQLTHIAKDKEQTVIWVEITQEAELVFKHLTEAGRRPLILNGDVPMKDREGLIEMFLDGLYTDLIGNPSCLKYGGNYSRVDHVIYLSPPIGLERSSQAMYRTLMPDKESFTTYHYLVAKGTFEEKYYESQKKKAMNNKAFTTFLKNYSKNLRK